MSDDKINLDLINMVQNARMQHDADATPSRVPGTYWIEAKYPQGAMPTPRTGEWRIHTTIEHVDALWLKIRAATEEGQLGYKSKVSTKPAHNQGHPDERLICVRTYDADDAADVQRVQAALRKLGVEAAMAYVRDKNT